MVNEVHRVILLCSSVLLFGTVFQNQAVAADNQVTELAHKAGIRILRDSSSDKQLQKTAAAQIPLNRMSQRSQQRALHLLRNTSQYRRMPTLQYEVDASLFQYLINHPDVAISTWRVMGISKLSMWETAPFEYAAKANDGSQGEADVLWRDGNQCVFVVQGAYHSPLLPTVIEASALVWLRYRFERTRDNRIVVNQQIETFINFPSPTIQTVAKLATVITNSILDRNVMEVSLYAQMMSRAVKKDPRWVEEVASRMDGVAPHRSVELMRVARGQNPYQRQASDEISVSSRLTPDGKQMHQAVAGRIVVIVKSDQNSAAAVQPPATRTPATRNVSLSRNTSPSTGLDNGNSSSNLSAESPLTTAGAAQTIWDSAMQLFSADAGQVSADAGQTSQGEAIPQTNSDVAHRLPESSGYSKDRTRSSRSPSALKTGPLSQTSRAAANTTGLKSALIETKGQPSSAAGSNGDQPALVTLPPVPANE